MASFETQGIGFDAVAELAMPALCVDCPMRAGSDKVELARIDPDVTPSDLALIEADAASDIVIAAIFRQKKGCSGAEIMDEPCPGCGEDRHCPSYSEFADKITEYYDASTNQDEQGE